MVRMLAARGTPSFYAYSRKLYGSPKDKFPDGKTSVRDIGLVLYEILTAISSETLLGPKQPRDIDRRDAAAELEPAASPRYFGDAAIRVQVDDTLLADAAAGSDYVKIRSGAKFSQRDIDILEVHEGWVHVATSLNGQAQPVAQVARQGAAAHDRGAGGARGAAARSSRSAATPRARRKLNDRILAVDKAEDGASFLDVFEWYRTEGYDEEECFHNTRRVFRGGVIDGGAPFTKDACYCKGIVLNYAFIRAAIQHNRARAHPVPLRRQGRARGRPGALRARDRRRREAAALPAADVPRHERARDLDGVLDLLLAPRRQRDRRLLRQAISARRRLTRNPTSPWHRDAGPRRALLLLFAFEGHRLLDAHLEPRLQRSLHLAEGQRFFGGDVLAGVLDDLAQEGVA